MIYYFGMVLIEKIKDKRTRGRMKSSAIRSRMIHCRRATSSIQGKTIVTSGGKCLFGLESSNDNVEIQVA